MNTTINKNVAVVEDSLRLRNCFLCDASLQTTPRNIHQLFQTTQKSDGSQDESLATTLSGILEQNIDETTAHSKAVCRKCQQMCMEYETMNKRLQSLRKTIVNNYAETAGKYNVRVIEMDYRDSFDDVHEQTQDEPDMANMYTIESVDGDMSDVLNNEHIVSGKSSKGLHMKKVMVMKAETDGASPYFSISEVDDSLDDSHGIQTVLMNDIDEAIEYSDSATNTNDDISDDHETDPGDPIGDFVGSEHLDDGCEEYFQTNGDQMIEINANGEISEATYQYMYHEDSSDQVDNDDDTMLMHESDKDENNVGMVLHVQRATTTKANDEIRLKQLFVRDGKKFKCCLCVGPQMDVLYDTKTISIHLKSDHNERIYVCSICGMDFWKRNPYNEHMDDHMAESSDGAYECELCKTVFTDARQFRIHKKTHNTTKIWTCKACDKKYSSKNLLEEHMNMHTGERPYKCPHCVKDFASKYTLSAHMKIHYDRKRPFPCSECGKSFFSNQNLMQHVRTHTGVKEYDCDVCGKKFGSPHNLEVHKIIHTGHKPFICRTCNKAFARRAEIKDHERTHTGERPYKCDMCSSSFAQRSNLMSHKRATHFNDKRYKCETCNRSFKRRRLLEYHIKATHTGERPYKCDQCNSTFVYPEHYKKHIRIHTGDKPFACEVCGKTFNSRDNRNAHRYIHSDKKPYECLVCHQGFMRKPLLYAHMESQNHMNDQIIINQPRIPIKKDGKNIEIIEECIDNDDGDIVYLNLNEQYIDDEFGVLEEKQLSDDVDDSLDNDPVSDNQFSKIETDHDDTRLNQHGHKQHTRSKANQRRDNLSTMDDLDIKESVTFIEADTDDPLNLEQICVTVDSDNVSWLNLSS